MNCRKGMLIEPTRKDKPNMAKSEKLGVLGFFTLEDQLRYISWIKMNQAIMNQLATGCGFINSKSSIHAKAIAAFVWSLMQNGAWRGAIIVDQKTLNILFPNSKVFLNDDEVRGGDHCGSWSERPIFHFLKEYCEPC